MRKMTWGEVFKKEISLIVCLLILTGAMGYFAYEIWGILGCVLAVIFAVVMIALILILDKTTLTICSCGKILDYTRCLNCGSVCSHCGEKIESE